MRILFLFLLVSNSSLAQKLPDPIYRTVPLRQVQPMGWLKDQLTIMRNGSTGHLDEIYNKIKNDNGWLGGKGDAWEETPYWLDGALPLAYLLNDEALEQKAMQYINWVLNNQKVNGDFGPVTDNGRDWWPKMIVLKILQQYYAASHNDRVIDFMTRYFNYQLTTLDKYDLGYWSQWSKARGTENLMMVCWLHNITGDKNLIPLADLLFKQSYTWSKWFEERYMLRNAAGPRKMVECDCK